MPSTVRNDGVEKQPSEWAVYREKEQTHLDTTPLKITCGICGKIFEGQSLGVREKALAHRTKKHPETLIRRKHRRKSARALHTFRYTSMDDDVKQEIQSEREKRAFLNGVNLES